MESKPDYLLATNRQKFSNVAVCGHAPRYNSDQFIVLGCLHILLLKEKKIYLGSWRCFPLNPPEIASGTSSYSLFRKLSEVIP